MGIIKRGSTGYEMSVMFFAGTGLAAVITARLLADQSERSDAGICTVALCVPCWVVFLVGRYFQRDQPQTILEFVYIAVQEIWWVPQVVLVFGVLTYPELLGVKMGSVASVVILVLTWRLVRHQPASGEAE